MKLCAIGALLGIGLVSCSRSAAPQVDSVKVASPPTSTAADAGPGPSAASHVGADDVEPSVAEAVPAFEDVAVVLFPDRREGAMRDCPASIPTEARIRCLFDARYAGDRRAASLAHELFARYGIVAGVEEPHTMNGGYRGMIRIVPAVPTLVDRKHLEWVALAVRDFEVFFHELEAYGEEHGQQVAGESRYRFRPLTLRFMRSVGKRTPTAYAHDWTVAYNLSGSLLVSADATRETMFHEIFHLNDGARRWWSGRALGEIFETIVRTCGTNVACLGPYTPNETKVRGGTYYAFQPGNGVMEYGAELALRYYREQRAALRDRKHPKAFKCGPTVNARAWHLIKDEFFGGVDATPACQ